MAKIALWWNNRSVRDRRALLVLALVLPAILLWYQVTVPLQDALQMSLRVLETRRVEALEVQKLLQQYAMIRGQLEGIEFKAADDVVPRLESSFRDMTASESRPILNRSSITIFGKNQPAASVRLDSAHPQTMWQFFNIIASAGVLLSELELHADVKTNTISCSVKAWLPVR